MRIIEHNEQHDIIQEDAKGYPITFRVWLNYDMVDIKADEHLAHANGYGSMNEMIESTIGKDMFESLFWNIPGWIRIFSNGGYTINKALFN